MTPLVLFALLAGLPFLAIMALRVHSSAFFISVASGYLLSEFIGGTAGLFSSSIFKNSPEITLLAVFLLPIVITIWFMRKSLPSSQLVVQILPQVANSLLIFALAVPLLSESIQATLAQDEIANSIIKMDDAVVTFAVVAQLALMIITARPQHRGKKG
jgi:hypothetical protein